MALNVDIDMRVDPESEVSMSVEDGDEVSFGVAEAIVVKDHAILDNRDLPDQHPISAITGLEEALANIDSMLVVNFTNTGGVYTADKTFAEIKEAVPNVIGKRSSSYFYLGGGGMSQATFIRNFVSPDIVHEEFFIVNADNTVTYIHDTVDIPTATSELQNDSGFVTADGVGNIVVDMNAYPFILVVMGSTALLYTPAGQPVTFLEFISRFAGAVDKVYVQVLNGATDLLQAQSRVFTVTYGDYTTATVKLTSIDNGTVYTAVMTDSGSGLVGTFSSQTIPTATSDLVNDSGFVTSSSLATVATTGDYDDLTNKPDLSVYMQKGVDYVTAGKKSGTTLGSKATAEGENTTASGVYNHAEGYGTTTSNTASHAEGMSTTASGGYSHAEGSTTVASGTGSHAEGNHTTASGYSSHAEGVYTIASKRGQHTFGEYNIAETGSVSVKGTYVEIVGNGTDESNRSNARTLDWSGNEVLAGTLTVGADPTNNMEVATKQYVDGAIPTVPTNVSAFTNDAGYLVASDLTEATDADVIAIVV